nr:4420_t:CDS:2 [Entrophospora candida]
MSNNYNIQHYKFFNSTSDQYESSENPIQNTQYMKQVAVCNGCKNEKSRRYPPILVPIPAAIQNVPMLHCKYLLPVHMNCSLGRAAGSNPYTSYVHLKGQINITHNYHALKLYSGTTGAFLNANEPSPWFHEALIPASNWLRQNNRLIKKYATDVNITHPLPGEPVPLQLPLAQHSYNNWNVLNESITTTLPSNLRTAAPFFKKKQHQVNTMVNAYGLPQIFYTLTMGEDKWPHSHQILQISDNGNTVPSNLPLHTYLHYRHRLTNVRNKLWKNPKIIQWGKWIHYFECDEFQHQGSIHTHGFAYTEKKSTELISLNTVRADLPDQNTETELHNLVKMFQIHHCNQRCRPQGYDNEQCTKGFPQPLSETTCCPPNSLCYVYKRTKDEDRMVVPYYPETLLLWKGHINFQYVTSTGFAKYITKYVTKPESSESCSTKYCGKTIHSELKIRYWEGCYETLIFSNPATKANLKNVDAIIFDEISMQDDLEFYNILQEILVGEISERSRKIIQSKIDTESNINV